MMKARATIEKLIGGEAWMTHRTGNHAVSLPFPILQAAFHFSVTSSNPPQASSNFKLLPFGACLVVCVKLTDFSIYCFLNRCPQLDTESPHLALINTVIGSQH